MSEAIVLTRIMFPYLVVISIAAFFQGILNGMKIFSPSGFTPILFNSIVIAATYILAPHTANPARAMAIGVITGGAVQALFQLPFVLKNNWKVTFASLPKAFSNPGTRKVIALVGPTIIGMAGYQINDIVSSALATRRRRCCFKPSVFAAASGTNTRNMRGNYRNSYSSRPYRICKTR